MDLWDVCKELELLAHVHGWETPVLGTDAMGGDPVDVWYSPDAGVIYIG